MIGMDPDAVRQLAAELRSHAATLSGVTATVDNVTHQIAGNWRGAGAGEFVDSWQRVHRPALLAAQASVSGLATSAQNDAVRQDQTSAATGAGAGTAGSSGIGPGLIGNVDREVVDHTRGDSYLIGPIVGAVPFAVRHMAPQVFEDLGGAGMERVFGVAGAVVTGVDGAVRFTQDVDEGHNALAAEQALETSGGVVLTAGIMTGDPALMLGGGVLLISSEAVRAGAAINWDELYHDPGELDPFAPGALGGVWQSETSGLEQLGKTIVGAL